VSPFTASRRSAVPWAALGRTVVAAAAVGLATACASAPPGLPAAIRAGAPVVVPGFIFERDTFAFRNDMREKTPDKPDLYANYCFVLARSMRQFFLFARFDPRAPRLDRDAYVTLVRKVVSRAPWQPALPPADRVVIPGYANLREFSRDQEGAVKEGVGGRFWTWVHWTNWRVVFPVTQSHQRHVLDEVLSELAAGRLVQLLITNWPKWEVNHTVVAFASHAIGGDVTLTIWDPNEPEGSGTITFESAKGTFWATRVYETQPGVIRVFRMYYSALL
jgi:hypothetical protein